MKGNETMKTLTNIIYPAFALVALAFLVLMPQAQALLPPPAPDGGYPDFNTAEGENALFNVTSPQGGSDTAIGYQALFNNTTGSGNTAVGESALNSNTTAHDNTAVGTEALAHNTESFNTAIGSLALFDNTTGTQNTAVGYAALFTNGF